MCNQLLECSFGNKVDERVYLLLTLTFGFRIRSLQEKEREMSQEVDTVKTGFYSAAKRQAFPK